jgi:hypothetical protein
MDGATRKRLAKLLARTSSPHEGEVLVAARKANELLAKLRLGWDDVLSSPPTWEITKRGNHEPPGWRAGLYNEAPVWMPDNRPRKIRAHRLRHCLGLVPLPIRILLAPLSVAAYLAVWVMEESDGAMDLLSRSIFSAFLSLAIFGLWSALILLLIEETSI